MHVSPLASNEPDATASRRIPNSHLLTIVRAVWISLAAIGVVHVFFFLSFLYSQYRSPPETLIRAGIAPAVFVGYFAALTILSLVIFYSISALIMWRWPDKVSVLVSIFLIALGSSPVDIDLLIELPALLSAFPLALPDSAVHPYNWPPLLFIFVVFSVWGSVYAIQVYRYRYNYSPTERQQTKRLVYGVALIVLINRPGFVLQTLLPTLVERDSSVVLASLFRGLADFSLVLLPVSIAFAVLRYRLWDIDLIINRTLLYVSHRKPENVCGPH